MFSVSSDLLDANNETKLLQFKSICCHHIDNTSSKNIFHKITVIMENHIITEIAINYQIWIILLQKDL